MSKDNLKKNDKISDKPFLMGFIAILLWSTQAVVISKANINVDFSAILFFSFLFSSIFFIVFKLFIDRKNFGQIIRLYPSEISFVFLGTILFFSYHFLLFLGLQIGPKIETNLTNFLWPLVFILLGCVILGKRFVISNIGKKLIEKFDKRIKREKELEIDVQNDQLDFLKIIKIIVGLIGIVLILTRGDFDQLNFYQWKGPLLGFIAAICWAIFSIYLKFLENVSYMSSFIGGSTIFSGIFWAYNGFPILLSTLVYSVYLGVFPLGFAMITWEKAVKNGNTQKIGTLAFLAPLISTSLLFLFNFGYLNKFFLIGGSLVVFANINFRNFKIIRYIGKKVKNYIESKDRFIPIHYID